MADLKEVFEMATKQIEPDQDSWKDQERRQRRVARNRKLGAFAAVAVILIAAGVFALTQKHTAGQPANHGSSAPTSIQPSSSIFAPMILGLDGKVQTRLAGIPVDSRSLTVSPDGQTVAFVVAGSSQIGTVGIDGTGLRLIRVPTGHGLNHSFPIDESAPAWSPDGSKIAFTNGDLYVMKADGSGLFKLPTGGTGVDLWPSWSPDGSAIAYSNSGSKPIDGSGFSPTQEIWTIPVVRGAPTRLTHNNVPDDMPSFAPDGQKIVFYSDGKLALMDPTGANQRPVKGQASGFNPRWSPGGAKIVYITYYAARRAADGGPLLQIHVVDPRTGVSSKLPGFVDSDVDAPSWMPSGALLVNRYTGG